ncbi:DUF4397 domain-containing protein [Sabulibacter ruber]|uniref:DUF4397 domain-containing protein n=1 Tax=Sabulibacter ruber TaxID=2811901 RepID=UPI001A96C54F|nr:DUF4397 domain-containing protein [Sabulibacter ruber]
MKKIFNRIAAFLAIGFALGACEENAIPERTTYVTSGAQVKFYNHVEGSPMVNFYLNDQKVTTATATATGALRGLAFGATYPSTYGYASVPSGSFTMAVRDTATREAASYDPAASCKVLTWKDLASPYRTIIDKAVTLDEGSNYSAILVGTPAVMGTTATTCGQVVTQANYELIVSRDALPAPAFDKIYFRFMNTLAGAPYNFDVVATRLANAASGSTPARDKVEIVIAQNIGFKEFSPYVEVPMGNYRIDYYKAGTYKTANEVKYLSYPSTATSSISTLALGRVYTHFLRGTYSSPGKSTHMDYWRER